MMPETVPSLQNTTISVEGINVYVDSVIGAGGCGTVYRAYSESLQGHALALKVCRPIPQHPSTEDTRPVEYDQKQDLCNEPDRTVREFKIMQMLQHSPGIAKVLLSGVIQDSEGKNWGVGVIPYCVGTLREWIHRGGSNDVARCIWIAQEAATAIQYAHDNGIIHRDVKPGNILFATDGRVVLGDFGLAIRSNAKGILDAGTPGYAAPEHLKGSPSFASDQYSLAVTVSEMLTGNLEPEAAVAVVREMTKSSAGLLPAMGPAILRALSDQEKDRYLSVVAFAHDLEDRAYAEMGSGAEAKKLFPRAWSRQQARMLTVEAKKNAQSGQYSEALALYERAITHDSSNMQAHFQKAHVLESLGQQNEARTAFMTAYNCPLKEPVDLVRRGIIMARFEWHEAALENFTRARTAYKYATPATRLYEARSMEAQARVEVQRGNTIKAYQLLYDAQALYELPQSKKSDQDARISEEHLENMATVRVPAV